VEACVLCDETAVVMEIATPLADDGIEIVDRGEVVVGKRLVDERPKMLGRL
jgi:hypothetical protein